MSTNISKEKRENLLSKIKQIKDYISACKQDENTGNLLTYISELEKEIKGKKYGLVFEEHREGIDETLATHIPVLTEEKDLFIDNGGQMNFLIEGDNLASLQLLEKTYKGKIDLIYIDPPYNTGNNDFIYDDNFVDREDKYRHSKWLSFIKKRLAIAKRLLSREGVIFISIDDNELTPLNMLMMEMFGEENLIGILPRITKKSGKQHSESIAKNHDYVLVYAKDYTKSQFKGESVDNEDYPFTDEFVKERGPYKLNQTLDYDSLWYNPAMDFAINVGDITYYPGGSLEKHNDRHNGIHKSKDWVWRWSQAKFDFGYENGFVVIKEGKDRPRIYTKTYLNAKIDKDKNGGYFVSIVPRESNMSSLALVDNEYSNDNAKKELGKVLDAQAFDFPKPTSLIKKLLSIVDKDNITVLDFFVGSGTTGHAVMKLNAEDGGNRKFILCTNNENNICRDITYGRIKRVIDKEGYPASLKYYKVDYIPISEKFYYEYADELLLHIRELVELENGINFNENSELAILLSEKEVEEFITHEDKLKSCKKIYLGHDVLLDGKQESIFELNKIEINVIPEYYYKEMEA